LNRTAEKRAKLPGERALAVAAQAVVRVEYRAPDKKTFNKTSEKWIG
jgi:hypothetical protein